MYIIMIIEPFNTIQWWKNSCNTLSEFYVHILTCLYKYCEDKSLANYKDKFFLGPAVLHNHCIMTMTQ